MATIKSIVGRVEQSYTFNYSPLKKYIYEFDSSRPIALKQIFFFLCFARQNLNENNCFTQLIKTNWIKEREIVKLVCRQTFSSYTIFGCILSRFLVCRWMCVLIFNIKTKCAIDTRIFVEYLIWVPPPTTTPLAYNQIEYLDSDSVLTLKHWPSLSVFWWIFIGDLNRVC